MSADSLLSYSVLASAFTCLMPPDLGTESGHKAQHDHAVGIRKIVAQVLVLAGGRAYSMADLTGVWDETGLSALVDRRDQDHLVA